MSAAVDYFGLRPFEPTQAAAWDAAAATLNAADAAYQSAEAALRAASSAYAATPDSPHLDALNSAQAAADAAREAAINARVWRPAATRSAMLVLQSADQAYAVAQRDAEVALRDAPVMPSGAQETAVSDAMAALDAVRVSLAASQADRVGHNDNVESIKAYLASTAPVKPMTPYAQAQADRDADRTVDARRRIGVLIDAVSPDLRSFLRMVCETSP